MRKPGLRGAPGREENESLTFPLVAKGSPKRRRDRERESRTLMAVRGCRCRLLERRKREEESEGSHRRGKVHREK